MESEVEIDLTKVCRHNIRRNCDLRCIKCKKLYPCKACHDEAENSIYMDPWLKHELKMKDMKEIKCRRCN